MMLVVGLLVGFVVVLRVVFCCLWFSLVVWILVFVLGLLICRFSFGTCLIGLIVLRCLVWLVAL